MNQNIGSVMLHRLHKYYQTISSIEMFVGNRDHSRKKWLGCLTPNDRGVPTHPSGRWSLNQRFHVLPGEGPRGRGGRSFAWKHIERDTMVVRMRWSQSNFRRSKINFGRFWFLGATDRTTDNKLRKKSVVILIFGVEYETISGEKKTVEIEQHGRFFSFGHEWHF